jgi:cobalt-zinc-cadmium efflux system protein
MTSGIPALSAHVLVGTEDDCHARGRTWRSCCTIGRIEHTTLQVDYEGGDLLEIEIRGGG